jgi:hypothetical protein
MVAESIVPVVPFEAPRVERRLLVPIGTTDGRTLPSPPFPAHDDREDVVPIGSHDFHRETAGKVECLMPHG